MSSKAVSKKQPAIQKSLFATYNKNFQLKVYQHEVIDEHGNVKLVSNKISSSKAILMLKSNIGWLSIG